MGKIRKSYPLFAGAGLSSSDQQELIQLIKYHPLAISIFFFIVVLIVVIFNLWYGVKGIREKKTYFSGMLGNVAVQGKDAQWQGIQYIIIATVAIIILIFLGWFIGVQIVKNIG